MARVKKTSPCLTRMQETQRRRTEHAGCVGDPRSQSLRGGICRFPLGPTMRQSAGAAGRWRRFMTMPYGLYSGFKVRLSLASKSRAGRMGMRCPRRWARQNERLGLRKSWRRCDAGAFPFFFVFLWFRRYPLVGYFGVGIKAISKVRYQSHLQTSLSHLHQISQMLVGLIRVKVCENVSHCIDYPEPSNQTPN